MTTIWKFKIKLADEQDVPMPMGVHVLSAGLDPGGDLCVWAEVPGLMPRNMAEVGIDYGKRRIVICGTGNLLVADSRRKFLGTVTAGLFVWHVYDGGFWA